MARAKYKLPNVFVGCPYGGKFNFKSFKAALDRIPFRWYYADTNITTKHLLGILTSYIKSVDYCLFDISEWNPNVALEIGLAQGLGVDYYILLNRSLTKGVPADIQGLQRIEYNDYHSIEAQSLRPLIIKYLVADLTHPRNIRNALSGDNKSKKFIFALEALAHLRDNKRFTDEDSRKASRGSYLRKHDRDEVIRTLCDLGLCSSGRSMNGLGLKRNLFAEPLRIR